MPWHGIGIDAPLMQIISFNHNNAIIYFFLELNVDGWHLYHANTPFQRNFTKTKQYIIQEFCDPIQTQISNFKGRPNLWAGSGWSRCCDPMFTRRLNHSSTNHTRKHTPWVSWLFRFWSTLKPSLTSFSKTPVVCETFIDMILARWSHEK